MLLVSPDNQETWADVQIAAFALYTGQTDVARTILEGARADVAQEFEPDGRQPRELAQHTLLGLQHLRFDGVSAPGCTRGTRRRRSLEYTTADGRSLRKGVDYLVPFATGEKRFP